VLKDRSARSTPEHHTPTTKEHSRKNKGAEGARTKQEADRKRNERSGPGGKRWERVGDRWFLEDWEKRGNVRQGGEQGGPKQGGRDDGPAVTGLERDRTSGSVRAKDGVEDGCKKIKRGEGKQKCAQERDEHGGRGGTRGVLIGKGGTGH